MNTPRSMKERRESAWPAHRFVAWPRYGDRCRCDGCGLPASDLVHLPLIRRVLWRLHVRWV